MKIAIDARLYGTENTGLGRYTMNLVDELVRIDHENKYFLILREKYFTELSLPANFSKIEADFPIYTFQEQLLLSPLLKKIQPDIVHFPHFNVPFSFNKKYIVTVHDIIMQKQGRDASTLSVPLYYMKRFPFKYIAYHAVNQAEMIICPSKTVKKELQDFYNISEEKISVVYEGVDTHIRQVKSSKNKYDRYFLYIGNAYPHKNLRFLIKCIEQLNKENEKKVKLLIRTDENDFRKKLENYVKQNKSDKYIKFLDFVSDEELADLYQNSIAYVFPSFSEGFGLPGLEAIQNNTVLLASDIPVFKEVYENSAIYFDPKDSKDLINKLKKVLDMDKSRRLSHIKRSQKILKKYSWTRSAEETIKIYKSVYKDLQ